MIKINGVEIGTNCFPNNERIFSTDDLHCLYTEDEVTVEFKYETDMDISKLIFVKKFLDDCFRNIKVDLLMSYIPYSRMDRQITGYMFSLKYFCQLINDLKFEAVYVLDPHSNVSSALLNRCVEMDLIGNVCDVFSQLQHDIDFIFYPDLGACKRYSEILDLEFPYFCGNKRRNHQTGEITFYELIGCPDIKNKNILMVDDLCTKGTTALKACKLLKANGADKIYLYVSHCEYAIFESELIKSNLIENIFTTNSIIKNQKAR